MVYEPLYDTAYGEHTLGELREKVFQLDANKELFMHFGHFVGWYGAVEYLMTMFLHQFSGGFAPMQFHNLTRGMDANVKFERLKIAMRMAKCEMGDGLKKRFKHMTEKMVPLRNKLVHSHLYWPENGDLQITSLGKPPEFEDVRFPGEPPDKIGGLELFERGLWLQHFSVDLGTLFSAHFNNPARSKTLEADRYLSGLPKG